MRTQQMAALGYVNTREDKLHTRGHTYNDHSVVVPHVQALQYPFMSVALLQYLHCYIKGYFV